MISLFYFAHVKELTGKEKRDASMDKRNGS